MFNRDQMSKMTFFLNLLTSVMWHLKLIVAGKGFHILFYFKVITYSGGLFDSPIIQKTQSLLFVIYL